MSQIQALGAGNGAGGTNSYVTDAGIAIPAAGIINILGAHGINTAGAGSTVTVAINNAITLGDLAVIATGASALTATTGDITITSGNLNMANTSAAGADGVINLNSVRFMHNFGGILPDFGNTFLGQNAGNFTLTSGVATENTGIGCQSLQSLTTGGANTGCGNQALQNCTTGFGNTAVGESALESCTIGDANTAVGTGALRRLTALGSLNTAWGYLALKDLLTGSRNIVIGHDSGELYVAAESNNILIGNVIGVASESNTLRVGGGTGSGADQQNRCFVSGINLVTSSNALMVTINSVTDQLGVDTLPSGARNWTVITGNIGMVANNGYIANAAANITLQLPATSAIGDILRVTGINTALGWTITQNANQQIFFGTSSTTLGVGGSLSSLNIRDSVELVCVVSGASARWNVLSSQGNVTIV